MASEEEVRQVARLARLSLEDSKIEGLTREFNAILEYVKTLEEVSVDEIEPMSHVHGSENVFREDKVVHVLTTEQGLKNAPDREETSFKVPLVIDSEE